jgi:hypothetical protein
LVTPFFLGWVGAKYAQFHFTQSFLSLTHHSSFPGAILADSGLKVAGGHFATEAFMGFGFKFGFVWWSWSSGADLDVLE